MHTTNRKTQDKLNSRKTLPQHCPTCTYKGESEQRLHQHRRMNKNAKSNGNKKKHSGGTVQTKNAKNTSPPEKRYKNTTIITATKKKKKTNTGTKTTTYKTNQKPKHR